MKIEEYQATWDLEGLFPGGSNSQEFREHLALSMDEIDKLSAYVHKYEPLQETDKDSLQQIVNQFEVVVKKVRQAGAFVSCLEAQNMEDKGASALRGRVTELSAAFQNVLTVLDGKLSLYSDMEWDSLFKGSNLEELYFVLSERRAAAKEKLSEEEETLINKLSVDGYYGWGQMYDTIVGKIQIPFDEEYLSVGQAANKFSNPERAVRKRCLKNGKKHGMQMGKFWQKH